MQQKILAYIIALIIFTVLEALWLTQAAPYIYAPLSPIMREQPNLLSALFFFLAYPIGILYFTVFSNLDSISKISERAVMLGLLCYGTYSLTNLATLQGWTATISLFEICWGMILTALTAIATAKIYSKIYPPSSK